MARRYNSLKSFIKVSDRPTPSAWEIARCNDGDGPNEQYRCACLLAEACGVELEDGVR